MSRLIPIFFLIALLAVTSSGAVVSPMTYWKRVLPTTSIPDALESFLPKGSGPRYGGQWVRTSKSGDFLRFYGNRRYQRRYGFIRHQHVAKLVSPPKGLFFLEECLKPGTAMDIRFLVANINSDQEMPTFLPRQVAEALPFSTSSFPTILQRFSLSAASPEASTMKETLEDCESPAMRGETKHCATSLESMIDFATTQLGSNNLHVFSTVVHKTKQQVDRSYMVQPGIVKMDSSNAVACHPAAYAYAVFYCHKIIDTRSYVVPLMDAEDRSRVDAVAVCHADTSQWDPEHPSFKMLGVKPGTVPICHFLPHNNFLWISK